MRHFLGDDRACEGNRSGPDLPGRIGSTGQAQDAADRDDSKCFCVCFCGRREVCNASGPLEVPTEPVGWADTTPPAEADNRSLLLFDRGDEVMVKAGEDGIRFLLVAGEPLQEPVAWYGPIVMNTQAELQTAFRELQEGTFLKRKTYER